MDISTLYEQFLSSRFGRGMNEEQKLFVKHVFKKENLFLTGSGGVGKSFVINAIHDFLIAYNYRVFKTALTGVAALNIGGSTIYSFSGIGLGDEDKHSLYNKVLNSKKAKARICSAQLLIIDEISMMSAELINKINFIYKKIRKSELPFGGLQVIASGDWLQLKPVTKNTFEGANYAFKSEAWQGSKFKMFELKTLMRQDGKSSFAEFLQNIRFGKEADFSILEPCYTRKFPADIIPIKMFCKNVDIEKYNKDKLAELKTPQKIYYAETTGNLELMPFFDKNCPAPNVLELKVGSQVMLLKNLDTEGGLVNGSMGKVMGFTTDGPVIKFYSGRQEIVSNEEWSVKEQYAKDGVIKYRVIAKRIQIPLKLAYATSIHKCLPLKTKIITERGIKPIKDLKPNDDNVFDENGSGPVLEKCFTGNKGLLRLESSSGYNLKCSREHKIGIMDANGHILYKKAEELKNGDSIVLRKGVGNERASDIGNDLAWWLGATVGDGSYASPIKSSYLISFFNKKTECGDSWKRISEKVFNARVTEKPYGNIHRYYFHSKKIRQYLLSIGLDYATCHTKKVPDIIWKSSRANILNFIYGLIDTDGHISKLGLNIVSANKTLLEEIQLLFLILGYRSSLYNEKDSFKLQLNRKEAKKFLIRNELRAKLKYKHLNIVLRDIKQGVPRSNISDYPFDRVFIEGIKEEICNKYGRKYGSGKRVRSLSSKVGHTINKLIQGKNFGIDLIEFLKNEITDFKDLGPNCKILNDFYENGVFTDKIISIKDDGEEECCDIECETHHFIANGFLVHNSQGLTLDYADIDLNEAWEEGQHYVALSRVKSLDGLKLERFDTRKVKANPDCLKFYRENS